MRCGGQGVSQLLPSWVEGALTYSIMKKNLTYEQAMQRLETIVDGFEQNTLQLDQLTTQLAEAQELIKFCNEKLQHVENDVKKMLDNGKEQTL